MFDLFPVLQRIEACCPSIKNADFALNVPEAIESIKRSPAVFVLQANIKARPNVNASAQHLQLLTQEFDVVSFLNATGLRGANRALQRAATDLLAAHCRELYAALIGWSWDRSITPIALVRGQLVQLSGSHLIWADRFSFEGQWRTTTA